MKKSMLFGLLLLGSAPVFAQLSLGIRAGANFASAAFDPDTDASFENKPELLIGGLLEARLGQFLAVQPEVTYLRKGYLANQSVLGIDTENELDMQYLDIGAMLKLMAGGENLRLFLGAGLFYGLALNGEFSSRAGGVELSSDVTFDNDYERSEWSAALAAGLQFQLGQGSLFLDARFQPGLTDIEKRSESQEVKNRGIGLSAGLLFPL